MALFLKPPNRGTPTQANFLTGSVNCLDMSSTLLTFNYALLLLKLVGSLHTGRIKVYSFFRCY